MNAFVRWLHDFAPMPVSVDNKERLRACFGALVGVLLCGLVSRQVLGSSAGLPLLIAPMGATAVLLFAVPSSPLAQPWPIVGGNIVSATIGVTCAKLIGDPIFASAVAISAAIGVMHVLRCLHPPSGAIALLAVLGAPPIQALGYRYVATPVAINSVLLLLVAMLFNNATRRRYPHPQKIDQDNVHRTADPRPTARLGFTPEDLDEVLRQHNQVVDISRDDLENIILQTEMHAYRRRFGEVYCADIMSRDLITVRSDTPLQEAWRLLHQHRVKALPVIDQDHRVIGIITLADFAKHARSYEGFAAGLRRFIHQAKPHWAEPQMAGQIMTAPVRVVRADMHMTELVPLLSDAGLHHIPVVDAGNRLVGIVTQSDLIGALYRGGVADQRNVA